MPPKDAEPFTWRDAIIPAAIVLAGFALLYTITWVYGHFRWGW